MCRIEINYKSLYKNMKKENEKLKKALNQQKNKEKMEQNDSLSLLQELSNKKQQLFETQSLLTEQNKKMVEMELVIQQQMAQLDKQTIQIEKWRVEKSKLSASITKMKQLKSLATADKLAAQKQSNLLKESQKLLQEELSKCQQTIQKQETKLIEMETMLNRFLLLEPSHLINHLTNQLNITSFNQFEDLPSLYKQYVQYHSLKKVSPSSNKSSSENKVEYGFLVKNPLLPQGKWQFVTTNSLSYEVAGKVKGKMKIGTPVSAVVNEAKKKAYICWFYQTESEMEHDRKTTNPQNLLTPHYKDDKVYLPIAPISVLIVTSKNGVQYRDRLTKHGVQADWVNPYEKSLTHIRNLSHSYDIVLLLEDAIPHEMRHLIKDFEEDHPDKIQTIYKHNEDIIVARVRYFAINNGLLSLTNIETGKE
ncbi:hypothetical protein [Neobacillus sp. D3-1R]|uniref:hypothetical protein n=1 Tax=Neobacillus sp. D3-1R TaxID=3445778 RepID=UPI003F9F1AFE